MNKIKTHIIICVTMLVVVTALVTYLLLGFGYEVTIVSLTSSLLYLNLVNMFMRRAEESERDKRTAESLRDLHTVRKDYFLEVLKTGFNTKRDEGLQ